MNLKFFVVLAFSLWPSFAYATVLTFDTITADSTCVTWGGSVDGFTIGDETAGFVADPACSFLNADGAFSPPNMMVNFNNRVGTIIKDSGTFDFNGAYFHADDREGNTVVEFAGYDLSDALVFSKSVEITPDWAWVSFEWAGISKFTWDPVSPSSSSNVSIDDFTYDGIAAVEIEPAIPVPTMSSYGIALTVMILLLMASRRLRASTKQR